MDPASTLPRFLHLPDISPLLGHISACQSAILPGDRVQWHIGTASVGYFKPDFAAAFCDYFGAAARRDQSGITLDPAAAPQLNDAARQLSPDFGFSHRGEDFDVRDPATDQTLAVLDRGAVPRFGVIGAGVHLNGVVKRADGPHLWIAKRSASKKLDPDKFDNLVGGGVSAGLTPEATLAKEAAEEAAIPADLIAKAIPVARIDYAMERPEGLRRDRLYCYDLILPADFTPHAADGEVDEFALWSAQQILQTMLEGDAFKFNVNLVLIDWLIRENLLSQHARRTLRAALPGATV